MKQFGRMENSLITLVIFLFAFTTTKADSDSLFVSTYLVLDPIETPVPALMSDKLKKDDFKNLLLFEDMEISNLWPSQGDVFNWSMKNKSSWKEKETIDSRLVIDQLPGENASTAYAAFYIRVDRFMKVDLKLKSPQMVNVVLDGKAIAKKDSFEKPDEQGDTLPGEVNAKLKLETGKHLIIIKTVISKEMSSEWYLESWLEVDSTCSESISLSTDNIKYADFKELLDNEKVKDVSVSPDGNIAAIHFSKRDLVEDKNEGWIELYDTEDASLISTFKGGFGVSNLDWAPTGVMFAYKTSGSKGGSIWIYNLSSGENYELLKNVKDLSGFIWTPDAGSIIYTTNTRPEPKDKNFKKYEKVEDRWPYGNDISSIYQVFLPDGVKRRLTSPDYTAYIGDISPDSKTLIFSTTKYDATRWPFSSTTYYSLDLNTLKADSLFEMIFANNILFSPDGNNLLVKGGPSSFDGIGKNVPDDMWPNDYDNQAFIYNLKNSSVTPITKEFDPAIDEMFRIRSSNSVYFTVTDKAYKKLYRYNVKEKSFSLVELDDEYITEIDFADDGSKAVLISESSNVPRRVFVMDLATEEYNQILFPDERSFDDIKLGIVEDYDFTSREGKTIVGRVYYPPDFDKSKTYPLIVHFYGGTSPITRNFEGRYPQNVWAANGYVVYTLQPSGSTGFGQEFSAAHVNDWGKTTSREIIEGAEKFIDEHEFIDPERVGCIGASYGGFMTMTLLTKTGMFRAGIAHAGISTLTSYWGEGYWGPAYSAVATANSYPWNRKDIYVDQSPIYNADKVTTPLLLLHGNTDPNVPKGESWSMYAALKILGKDVEFIEIDQQGHWIMDYHKRNKWSRTILAYFDKYLKDQPEWWQELYK